MEFHAGRPAGSCPANISAWSKTYLGWLDPVDVTSNKSAMFANVDGNSTVYRLWPGGNTGSSEYFLVEYRRKANYDAGLPGEGVLVWHIDSQQISSAIAGNEIDANENRLGVELEEADGKYDMWYMNNAGDAGDPFSGTGENCNFMAVPYGINTYNG